MKKLALTVALLALWAIQVVHAAEFFCPSGDVTCLIAAINEANALPGEHVINLEPGSYMLQTVDNGPPFDGIGLPVITSSIRINGSADDPRTVIERDPAAPPFGIFQITVSGELTLDGVTIKRGSSGTIRNSGLTTLQDSIVTESGGGDSGSGAIINGGTLRVIRTIISNNGGREGGAILNGSIGNLTLEPILVVENSTIARNGSVVGGGIFNLGSLIVKNSATFLTAQIAARQARASSTVEAQHKSSIRQSQKTEQGQVVQAYPIAAACSLRTARFGRIWRALR
jgi:hypothetical protein